jgi:putative FmdB family regulatory protein
MPIYEYECPACEKVFEVHQGINDSPLTSCSVCGGEVKKIVSMSAFHLKGGGWYSDGYASTSTSASASASTSGSSAQSGAGNKAAEKSAASTDSAKKASACGTDSACKGCPASS